MAINCLVRCGKYTFRTRMVIGVGDVFKSSTGHVGIITTVGFPGTHPEPTAEIVEQLYKGKDAMAWVAKRKGRRMAYRRAIRQDEALNALEEKRQAVGNQVGPSGTKL